MRRIRLAAVLAAALSSGLAGSAWAQSTEDKLREALRHTTVDLRALQDQQAQLQAERDAATKQRDLLQQQLADAQAKLTQAAAVPAVKPADPEELKKLQDLLEDARRQMSALAASNAKWQAAYRDAAALAQTREAETRRTAQALQAAQKEDQLSHATNAKLAALAGDILHLYRSQDFRGVLLRSYEPALGLGKVTLDNTVQDYEDRIADLRLYQAVPPPRP